MTDHKTDAERLVNTREVYKPAALVAQVHATLYLAEQQRLSNVLTMIAHNIDQVNRWSVQAAIQLGINPPLNEADYAAIEAFPIGDGKTIADLRPRIAELQQIVLDGMGL